MTGRASEGCHRPPARRLRRSTAFVVATALVIVAVGSAACSSLSATPSSGPAHVVRVVSGAPDEVITSETLSRLYGTPIEVLSTSDGQLVVVGQPEAPAHHHDRHSGVVR